MRPFPKNWRLFLWLVLAFLTLPTPVSPLSGGALLSQQPTVKEQERQTLLFAGDVLTKIEYSAGSQIVRWVKPPTISVFGNANGNRAVMAATLREINSALPKNMQVVQLNDGDRGASMKIFFVKLKDFAKVAAMFQFQYVEGNNGFFYMKWNGKFELTEAIILIAEDKLTGKSLSHFVLEETVQSLGMGGDSERFPKSIFYENQSLKQFGDATQLSPLDRKLVRFFYDHVPAGATAIEVGQLYERHWDAVGQ